MPEDTLDKFTYSRKPTAAELARVVSDAVNVFGFSEEEFIEVFVREHRTLQQAFTSLCFEWIKKCAEMDKNDCYDGRNEYSVKKCAEIVAKVEIFKCPFL